MLYIQHVKLQVKVKYNVFLRSWSPKAPVLWCFWTMTVSTDLQSFSSAWSRQHQAVWLRRPSVNCLTSPSPHQSAASVADKKPSRRGREEGGGVQWGGSVKRPAKSRAKPADRAIAGPPRPDTTLDHLKEPSKELMWEHNERGWKTRHVFVGLVICRRIAAKKA